MKRFLPSRARSITLGTLGLLLVVQTGLAHDAPLDRTIRAARTAQPPVIDGVPGEEVWMSAEPVTGFIQQTPDTGEPSRENTVVRLLYDDEALYVAAWLYDSENVTSQLARRDSYLAADWFAIYLDTHHDHRTGLMFRVNPVGVERDATVLDEDEDRDWDAVWASAATVTSDGWRAEMRIPWSQMRFPERERHVWGINFHREIARTNEYSRLVVVPRNEEGFISRFAHLEGIEGIDPGRSLEIVPYVSGSVIERGTTVAEDPFDDDGETKSDAGLDLRYGITSNLTLRAALNPDFGQVEVDPARINLTAFELFFPEKRPFFIEGSSLFEFETDGPDLFYSRRIGRAPQAEPAGPVDFVDLPEQTTILGAAKLTGKTRGGWTIAILDALTDEERAFFTIEGERDVQVVEPMTNYFVGRVAKDFGTDAQLGGILTSVERRTDEDTSMLRGSAWSGGLDGYRYFGDKDFRVDVALFGSRVEGSRRSIELTQRSSARYYQRPDADHVELDPDRTSLGGWGGRIRFDKLTGNWRYRTAVHSTSPGFESNDIGFMSTADRISTEVAAGYVEPEPGEISREWEIEFSKLDHWNHDNDRLVDRVAFDASTTFLNYWRTRVFARTDASVMNDRKTRGGPLVQEPDDWYAEISVGSDFRHPFFFEVEIGTSEDGLGGRFDVGRLRARYRPATHVEISFSPELEVRRDPVQYLQTVPDPLAATTFGNRYVFGEIERRTLNLTTRLDWSFSPDLSLQLFLQPFIATGDYVSFRQLVAPSTMDYEVYGAETGTVSFDETENRYTIDPDGAGPADPFSFANPDFNFRSLRGNAVLRWEFRPGSTVYVAWTQNREERAQIGDFDADRDLSALSGLEADDVFLIKFSYWLGL